MQLLLAWVVRGGDLHWYFFRGRWFNCDTTCWSRSSLSLLKCSLWESTDATDRSCFHFDHVATASTDQQSKSNIPKFSPGFHVRKTLSHYQSLRFESTGVESEKRLAPIQHWASQTSYPKDNWQPENQFCVPHELPNSRSPSSPRRYLFPNDQNDCDCLPKTDADQSICSLESKRVSTLSRPVLFKNCLDIKIFTEKHFVMDSSYTKLSYLMIPCQRSQYMSQSRTTERAVEQLKSRPRQL